MAAGRIFYYNSLMRRKLRVPQIAAVMGPCIAGGAYLPALSDYIIMVEGTSFMGLGGPNLVKGATGQVVDSESIGGARMHTTVSGVAHYMAKDDAECLARIRQRFRELPAPPAPRKPTARASRRRYLRRAAREPSPALRHRRSRLPHFRRGRLHRIPARLRARDAVRQRAPVRPPGGHHRQPPRLPALGRTPAHRRHRLHRIRAQSGVFRGTQRAPGHPLIYLQDVSGFMVGPEAEREGIIRAGADMVEAMSCTRCRSSS
jgi:3-methylcrotonyl-CoA carboxylase beta subunit